jgi:hypothetical protein
LTAGLNLVIEDPLFLEKPSDGNNFYKHNAELVVVQLKHGVYPPLIFL